MTTGLWVLFWVLVVLCFIGILLWAANRKPVEPEANLDQNLSQRQIERGLQFTQERSYLHDIYPVTGEYPKPLTGIQKEAVEREFAAGSTAVAEVKFEHKPIPGDEFSDPVVASMFGKAKRPSVKSKAPVAKKKVPAKKAKPVAKKKAKKKV